MPTRGDGAIGALDYPPEERKRLAAESIRWCCDSCGSRNHDALPPDDGKDATDANVTSVAPGTPMKPQTSQPSDGKAEVTSPQETSAPPQPIAPPPSITPLERQPNPEPTPSVSPSNQRTPTTQPVNPPVLPVGITEEELIHRRRTISQLDTFITFLLIAIMSLLVRKFIPSNPSPDLL
eukprot:TRINITY_DN9033_c0_g1_i2.p1 TRINITY_DN9033_c0_g1~~TRINITY_DN9033_c0_g1_i2.p1  ORF type:complete len:179 (+),score=33.61 TRINITY_DN9033_c0_g1_i2:436-972(+)